MTDETTARLLDAIESLQKQTPSREVALAITKAQEALMWWREARIKAQGEIA